VYRQIKLNSIPPHSGRSIPLQFNQVKNRTRIIVAPTALAGSVLLVLLVFNTVKDFFPVNGDIAWRIDTDPDLIPLHTKNSDSDFVTNH